MFAFKLWGHFGVFRDPITITQNITFSIPPKTTIGGMLAAILGIDYNDYFNDDDYFDFKYSLVLNSHIRKKSFSQNYVEDYTKKSAIKNKNFIGLNEKRLSLSSLKEEKQAFLERKNLSKNNSLGLDFGENNYPLPIREERKLAGLDKKILNATKKLEKQFKKVNDNLSQKMTKPKPIRRELLINPSYTIFIHNYKYEKKIVSAMRNHQSSFMFYMGNSEFPANYKYLDCLESKSSELSSVNSFTHSLDKIKFEEGNKYSTVYFATKVVENRKYRDYRKLVIGDYGKTISLKEKINGYSIKLETGDYNCEFI
ncbi:MAG: CRISPR-associated protein Cas5 [Bacteroidota bacterium]|nr:CRISPR-associated protein Cas5 [Bacteroidota bacterium]